MTPPAEKIKAIHNSVKVIGFDADDTLWVNETYYRETEEKFAQLMLPYAATDHATSLLTESEIKNLPLYGYGAKSLTLSMLETAMELSKGKASPETVSGILQLGKDLLQKPVILLEGSQQVLRELKNQYTLILITKGDLNDQERKLKASGLDQCFQHIEIVSEKTEQQYQELLSLLQTTPDEFMMVGNSLKSDIMPVLKIGGWGVHVPFHTTWVHEETHEDPTKWSRFFALEHLDELLKVFA
jgi:putative hydrolase of the HAD superfamily